MRKGGGGVPDGTWRFILGRDVPLENVSVYTRMTHGK